MPQPVHQDQVAAGVNMAAQQLIKAGLFHPHDHIAQHPAVIGAHSPGRQQPLFGPGAVDQATAFTGGIQHTPGGVQLFFGNHIVGAVAALSKAVIDVKPGIFPHLLGVLIQHLVQKAGIIVPPAQGTVHRGIGGEAVRRAFQFVQKPVHILMQPGKPGRGLLGQRPLIAGDDNAHHHHIAQQQRQQRCQQQRHKQAVPEGAFNPCAHGIPSPTSAAHRERISVWCRLAQEVS